MERTPANAENAALPTDEAVPGGELLVGAADTAAPVASPPRAASGSDEGQPTGAAGMNKRTFAAWSIGMGVAVGVIANALFFGKALGLSLFIFALVMVAAIAAAAWVRRIPFRARTWWLVVPILFFSLMLAVRADLSITFFNGVFALGLGTLLLYYLPLAHTPDEDSFDQYVLGVTGASVMIPFTPVFVSGMAWGWLREQRALTQKPALMAVMRGLLITVPIVLVFVVLLASADAIFEQYVSGFFNLFNSNWAASVAEQGFNVSLFAWFACGALAFGAARAVSGGMRRTPAAADEADAALFAEFQDAAAPPARPKKHPFMLGMIEAGMLLGAVNLLFGAFVVIQLRYFFGGEAALIAQGLTYAQYARRGFFELVAVSVLTLGVALWLDWVTVRSSRRQYTIFRALAVVLVGLTGVMLLSASGRMALYEEAFGYTHLRVYTHNFIRWMGALFVVFLLALFRLRDRVFSFGTLVVIIGYMMSMNLIDVEGYIAERNVGRYLSATGESSLDMCYLRTLSADAAPAMLMLFDAVQSREDDAEAAAFENEAGRWLALELRALDYARTNANASQPYVPILSWHAAKDAAYALLKPREAELMPYLTRDTLSSYDCYLGDLSGLR